jgi:hypothetical protein
VRLTLIQLTTFRVNWKRLGLSDDDLRKLEVVIMDSPERSPLIGGTGGLRKIRFAGAKSSSGKSGALRVCYAYFREFDLVYLCAVYPKNEAANLTAEERNAYRRVLADFSRYLREHFDEGMTP